MYIKYTSDKEQCCQYIESVSEKFRESSYFSQTIRLSHLVQKISCHQKCTSNLIQVKTKLKSTWNSIKTNPKSKTTALNCSTCLWESISFQGNTPEEISIFQLTAQKFTAVGWPLEIRVISAESLPTTLQSMSLSWKRSIFVFVVSAKSTKYAIFFVCNWSRCIYM